MIYLQTRPSLPGEPTFDAFLILPAQRPPRYVILLQEMARHSRTAGLDTAAIDCACERVQGVTRFLDDSLKSAESASQLRAAHAKLIGLDAKLSATFFSPHRTLLYEGLVETLKITADRSAEGSLSRQCILGRPWGGCRKSSYCIHLNNSITRTRSVQTAEAFSLHRRAALDDCMNNINHATN